MKSKFNHFSVLAPWYEKFIEPTPPQKLLSYTQPSMQGLMLDVGGGTGRVAQFFENQAAHIIIADQSFKMMNEASKKASLKPACAESERLPFSKDLFDRIIMVDALHHVNHQQNTARELWRVLKPGGRIVIEEPDFRQKRVKFIALAEKIALMRSHFLTPAEISTLF